MKLLVIGIEDELFDEIKTDMHRTMEHDSAAVRGAHDVQAWATEILESHLAGRRLPRIRLSSLAETMDARPLF